MQSKLISFKTEFKEFISNLQDEICSSLEAVDGKEKFKEELWTREEGGGGRTRVLAFGNVLEKAGVNISYVEGSLPDSMLNYLKVSHRQFFATGISLVLHPINPFAPTVHANYRYFELYDSDKNLVDQWFGGGSDLTPCYLFDEDAIHFHLTQKKVCDQLNVSYYSKFKTACDEYFRNHHRNEGRGIGGTFFDYLRPNLETGSDHWYQFVTKMGSAFLESYIPILKKRMNQKFTEKNKHWQEIRRGRYVEFNLIHDKGTLFGLKTNGRIESILMSLPSIVRWEYNFEPEENTEEYRLTQILKNPREWV
ncbi:MAG: oxygen-dependent coproporphyrinogen oxidase [Leptospiraceae bacterium]|nr:oxygen-dependent coproporphyrinogen oxidase [Leptospiraceae bacterium]